MNTYVIRGLDENSRKVKIEIEAEELEEAVLISKNLCTTVHSVELLFEDEISEPLSSNDEDSPTLVEQVKEEIYSEPNSEEKISQTSLLNDTEKKKKLSMGCFGFISFVISAIILVTVFQGVFKGLGIIGGLPGAISGGLGFGIAVLIGFVVTKITNEKSLY